MVVEKQNLIELSVLILLYVHQKYATTLEVGLQAYLSKLTESKLTQAMEENMFDGESAEQEQNETFDGNEANSYGARQSRK